MTDADLLRRILGATRPDIPMDWHDQAWLAAKGLVTLEAIEADAATPAQLDADSTSFSFEEALCGATLTCALPILHDGDHERADGIRWTWPAPAPLDARKTILAYRRHLERGCECPKWPACSPHDANEWGGGAPDDCSPHGHGPLPAATPAPLDGMLGAALLNWYDTTHGNNFGHDHHCPAPWSDEPYTQPIFDGCTCGWSDVQRAEVRRVEEMK